MAFHAKFQTDRRNVIEMDFVRSFTERRLIENVIDKHFCPGNMYPVDIKYFLPQPATHWLTFAVPLCKSQVASQMFISVVPLHLPLGQLKLLLPTKREGRVGKNS